MDFFIEMISHFKPISNSSIFTVLAHKTIIRFTKAAD